MRVARTVDEFIALTLQYYPDAVVEEDEDGQLVIYTNLTVNDAGEVVEYIA